MATFDQRGQKVTYQYNAAGNINFGDVSQLTNIPLELKKLSVEVAKAVQAGVIDEEIGVDVDAKVKKAIIQVEKPNPNKQSILENITGAKTLIESMASAVGLVGGFAQAAEMIRRVL